MRGEGEGYEEHVREREEKYPREQPEKLNLRNKMEGKKTLRKREDFTYKRGY